MAAQALGVPAPKGSVPAIVAYSAVALRSAIAGTGLAKKPRLTSDHLRQLTADRLYSAKLAEDELGFGAKVKLADGIKEMAGQYLASAGGKKAEK